MLLLPAAHLWPAGAAGRPDWRRNLATKLPTDHFGDQLRRRRLEAGLSQEALAERSGLSARGISDLERGVNRSPQRETLLRLADALALPAADRAVFLAVAPRRAPSSRAGQSAEPNAPAALPTPLTVLRGRDAEVRQLTALLQPRLNAGSTARLVTLTGPGGVGKTRLALAVAAELVTAFAHGVVFVSLAELREPQLVLAELAQRTGLRAEEGRPVAETLATHLKNRQLLLVLDNFEHLLPAVPALARLLEDCPALTVLATSRLLLGVRGESVVTVEPLAVPDPGHLPPLEVLAQVPAVTVFLERVAEQRAGFELNAANAATVAGVSARLDGLPLALELAAAQVRLFSPRALLARLERRLEVLTRGPRDLPPRQQTMATTIAWSYDLLQTPAQAILRRVAVFAGGLTMEAAEAICLSEGGPPGAVLSGLTSLVDASLLQRSDAADGEARFTMLEVIREFAVDRLRESGDLTGVCRVHAGYFTELAEQAEPALRGTEQSVWLERLVAERDNMRAALHWCILEEGDRLLGLRLATALGNFWKMRGQYREGREWLRAALARQPAAEDGLRARALRQAGDLVYWLGDVALAQAEYEEALALWRAAGDSSQVAQCLLSLGNVALEEEDYGRARDLYEEGLATVGAAGDRQVRSRLLSNLGVLAEQEGNLEQALAAFEECAQVFRELGDGHSLAHQLANIGDTALLIGDRERARRCLLDSLAMRRDLEDTDGLRWTLHGLSFLVRQDGDAERAVRLLGAAERLTEQIGAILGAERQARYDEHLAALRAQLGEGAFMAAWAEGYALEEKAAISYALGL